MSQPCDNQAKLVSLHTTTTSPTNHQASYAAQPPFVVVDPCNPATGSPLPAFSRPLQWAQANQINACPRLRTTTIAPVPVFAAHCALDATLFTWLCSDPSTSSLSDGWKAPPSEDSDQQNPFGGRVVFSFLNSPLFKHQIVTHF